MDCDRSPIWADVAASIEEISRMGSELRLPFIAAQSDLGDPKPMADQAGRPYAETTFRWVDPGYEYWRDRRLALQAPFLRAARLTAEPFFYAEGRLRSWRATRTLDVIDCAQVTQKTGIAAAIIAPAHLSHGIVGAVVWAARETVPVEALFKEHGEHLHALALRLAASHCEATWSPREVSGVTSLTRREVQCVRWAAIGKTDGEIAIILSLSVSTVRFHLRNASAKLGATGRAQAIQAAAGLGFVGAH